ncbi:MAG: SPOR domain-containing protein, partial [Faecousia sp.]
RINTRRGSNGEYYGVLRGAASVGTPGIILEHSFHTQTRATRWLLEDTNLQRLAAEEAKVIAAYFGVEKTLYRVQTGAFSKLENAQKQAEALKKAGFEAIIKTDR